MEVGNEEFFGGGRVTYDPLIVVLITHLYSPPGHRKPGYKWVKVTVISSKQGGLQSSHRSDAVGLRPPRRT